MENNNYKSPANWASRIISAVIIVAILVGLFFLRSLSAYVFDLLIGIVAIFSAFEVENLLHKMDRPTWATIVGAFPIIVFVSIILSINLNLNFYYYITIVMGVLIFVFLLMLVLPLMFSKWGNRCRVKDNFASSLKFYSFSKAINTVFVCVWPTLLMSFAFLINHFSELVVSSGVYSNSFHVDFGLLGLVLLISTTVCADVFAMLAGRFIGGRKISLEKLGPGKSWTGLIAGIIGATIASVIVFFIFESIAWYDDMFVTVGVTWLDFLIGGIFFGIFSMAGDIFSSLFKRRAVVKDFSNIIPGHGGVMDRCNGMLMNAVMVFVFLILILFR
ncbi:MAG: phosphatidate cytidylyltransferase [Clostridia bacterium]|nr:phosphatidate cytidylyltransferase [Clostridia bacterium]